MGHPFCLGIAVGKHYQSGCKAAMPMVAISCATPQPWNNAFLRRQRHAGVDDDIDSDG